MADALCEVLLMRSLLQAEQDHGAPVGKASWLRQEWDLSAWAHLGVRELLGVSYRGQGRLI